MALSSAPFYANEPGIKRGVTFCEFLYHRIAHGYAVETDVYLLTLECGHTQERTTSRATVKRTKCTPCWRESSKGTRK